MPARLSLRNTSRWNVIWRTALPPLLCVLAPAAWAAPGAMLLDAGMDEREVHEIDFGQATDPDTFLTAAEIEVWARNHNLLLLPDDPGRNLQDFQAASIPARGVEFELAAPGDGRVFLYLDLVSFRDLENATPSRIRWLDVYVNDRLLTTLYQGSGPGSGTGLHLDSPTILVVEREFAMDRRLRVRIRPAPGDGFCAIWDAYVSAYDPRR